MELCDNCDTILGADAEWLDLFSENPKMLCKACKLEALYGRAEEERQKDRRREQAEVERLRVQQK